MSFSHSISTFRSICLGIGGFIFMTSPTLGQRQVAASKNLVWKPDIVSKYGENETVKILNFEGAVHDGTLNSLPYYIEKIPHPFPGQQVTVKLKNAQYEPFTTGAIIDLSIIGTEPELKSQSVTEKKQTQLGIILLPIRKNPSTQGVERLLSFDFELTPAGRSPQIQSSRVFAPNSVLASGEWYKIGVNQTGVHIITVDFLRDLGMNPSSVNPSQIRLYGNGGGMLPFLNSKFRHDDLAENAIFVSDGGTQGAFDGGDYVLFYGESPMEWYYDPTDDRFHHILHMLSDYTYYFITPNNNNGSSPKRIQNQYSTIVPTNYSTSTFDDYKVHEVESLNFIKSGRQWYGEQFDVDLTQTFNFSFPNIDLTEPVYVKSNVIAHSFSASNFRLNYGNQLLVQQNISAVGSGYTADYAAENTSSVTFNAISPTVSLTLTYYPTTSTSIGYLNYLEVNARRNLVMSGPQMLFQDKRSVGAGNVTAFNLNAGPLVKVWEVTDPTTVKLQQFVSGSTFHIETDSLRKFVAFDGSSYFTPVVAGTVANQNLHGLGSKDLLILCHPNFLTEAFRLANFHKTHDGMRVEVVTPEQV